MSNNWCELCPKKKNSCEECKKNKVKLDVKQNKKTKK